MKLQGIYTPIITAFSADGSIDYNAWKKVIDKQIDSGVHGLIIGGSTGEFYALSKEERLAQFDFAHDYIAARVPWIAGVNDMLATESYAYAAAAKAAATATAATADIAVTTAAVSAAAAAIAGAAAAATVAVALAADAAITAAT